MMNKKTVLFFLVFVTALFFNAGYRGPGALNADEIIIENVTIVDVEKGSLEHNQYIRIEGKRITEISDKAIKPGPNAKVIPGEDMIAMPGFINTHTHLWQHMAKGYYPSGKLQEWVRIYKGAHYLKKDELYWVMRAASSQALLSGITTVSDFASVNFREFSLDEVCDGIRDSGLDGAVVFWYPAAFYPDDIKASEIKRLREKYGKSIQIWMGQGPLSFFPLNSAYSGIQLAKNLEMRITEHTMENVKEQRDFYGKLSKYLKNHGKDLHEEDLEFLGELKKMGPPSKVAAVENLYRQARTILIVDEQKEKKQLTEEEKEKLEEVTGTRTISQVPLLEHFEALDHYVSVHSVWLTGEDIKIYNRQKEPVYISHNPESNMYLSSGIAPVLDFMEAGLTVTLATDGAASNDGIDFFSAMRGLWNLQKLYYLDSSVIKKIKPWEVIKIATINGAKALGLEKVTGSINEGKEADIMLLSKKSLGISPYVPIKEDQVVSLIIYSGGVRDVHTVISNGEIVVENGELKKYTEGDLATRLSEISTDTLKRVEEGKTVKEYFDLKQADINPYWLHYYSVREKDVFDITVKNSGEGNMRVRYAFSGTLFGGTVAAMMDAKSLDRFPGSNPKNYFDRTITLEPGKILRIIKTKDKFSYIIETPGGDEHRDIEKMPGEQLLLLVQPG